MLPLFNCIVLTSLTTGFRVGRVQQVFGIDLRTLAAFRVYAATLILVDLGFRATQLGVHYTDAGLLPRSVITAVLGHQGAFSLHLASGSFWFQSVLFSVAALLALSLLIGYRTRLVTVLSWMLLVSVQVRNPVINSGADLLLSALLFWGMFLPLGGRWSVDAALDPRADSYPNQYCSVASGAMLVQVMSVYFFTAFLKSGAEWWPDGTAVYYALHLDMFATHLGVFIRDWPVLLQWLTWLVLVLEFVCPVIVFLPFFTVPLRLICLALLAAMHIGFELCLEVELFPYVSLLSLTVFIPGWLWDVLGKRGAERRASIRVYHDPGCLFCRRLSAVIAQWLGLRSHLIVQSADEDPRALATLREQNSWVVFDTGGNQRTRFDAFLALLEVSPFWRWTSSLMRTSPVRYVGEHGYSWVARHRSSMGRLLNLWLKERTLPVTTPAPVSVALLFLASLVFLWNCHGLNQTDFELPDEVQWLLRNLRLEQRWGMFAPYPTKSEGWYVIPGVLENGTVVDVERGTVGEPDTSKPEMLSQTYPMYRWRKYLSILRSDGGVMYRQPYARYLCNRWNDGLQSPQRLKSFEIVFYKETTLPDYAPPTVEPVVLWVHDCLASAEEMLRRKAAAEMATRDLGGG